MSAQRVGPVLLAVALAVVVLAGPVPVVPRPTYQLRTVHDVAALSATTSDRHSSVDAEAAAAVSRCQLCFDFFDAMDGLLAKGLNQSEIERTAESLCILAGTNAEVCNGAVVEFAPELVYLMNVTYRGHSKDMCWVLGVCSSAAEQQAMPGWAVGHTLADLPAATAPHAVPSPPAPAPHARDIGTFLQLTDMHYDSSYTPGTNTACGKPTCCHATDGAGVPPNVAGQFGWYHCDGAPALEAAVADAIAALRPVPDFVLWTGDEAPDDIWMQSRQANVDAAVFLANTVGGALPGVTAYPVVGNHEPFPINQLDGPDSFGGDRWLYSALGAAWSSPQAPWLDATSVQTLQAGGYYSQVVRPGLRVVALNTQHGSPTNYWLMMNATDPSGQLAWFEAELAAATANGERVYVIAHIAFGNEMYAAYSQRVHEIIDPYHATVAALFFGHTHKDSIQIRRDLATDTIPQNIAFVAPSVTPQTDINPSFRVYQYDRATFEVVDYAQYTADLMAGNANGRLDFALAYTAKQAYNLTGFAPADFQDFVNRMATGGTGAANSLLTAYIQHHATVGRPTDGCESNPSCVTRTLCDAASFTPTLFRKCMNSTLSSPPLGSCSDGNAAIARFFG